MAAEHREPRPDDTAYVAALVREHDRPRYYAALFSSTAERADLFAIYGFAVEIERVPDQVSEPALGEIRLQWWRDALAGATGPGGRGSSPALRAVADAIARHGLPLAPFNALIDAPAADLYSNPPATLADVEGRTGETESVLFQMAAIVCGAAGPETVDAAGHAGIAYGVARRLSTFASERARGRTIVATDLLVRQDLTPADLFAPAPKKELAAAIAEMAALARRHLGLARAEIAALSAPVRSVFLPLAVVAPLLSRVERLRAAIIERDAHLSDFETLLRIGLARLR